jgi:hypothetical protein
MNYDTLYNSIQNDLGNATSSLNTIHSRDKKAKANALKKVKILQTILHQILVLKSLDQEEEE